MRRRAHRMLLIAFVACAVATAGCGAIGASQITVTARNDSQQPMVVQVIEGQSDEGAPYGEARTIQPGDEELVALGVPGGEWTVTVNGARLVGSSDAGGRRGELPVTLILPTPDHFAGGPYWEAPGGWAETGP